jgi:hypothetical protein
VEAFLVIGLDVRPVQRTGLSRLFVSRRRREGLLCIGRLFCDFIGSLLAGGSLLEGSDLMLVSSVKHSTSANELALSALDTSAKEVL